jgi:hypothetical protein
VKLTTHLHLVQRSENVWRYPSTPPIRLHGVMLSQAQGQLCLLTFTLLIPKEYSENFGMIINLSITFPAVCSYVMGKIAFCNWTDTATLHKDA